MKASTTGSACLAFALVKICGVDGQTLTASPTASAAVVLASGDGWTAQYFSDTRFMSQVGSGVVSAVDFDWGYGGPFGQGDYWSARYTGFVVPETTEYYTFGVRADDYASCFVDDVLVSWTGNDGRVALQGGRPYSIRFDFYETSGVASARLYWAGNSATAGSWQIVPQRLVYTSMRTINTLTPTVSRSNTMPITVTPSFTPTLATQATGNGWLGRYYSGTSYTTQVGSSVWSTIDLDWGSGGPGGMSDYWSIRFTGFLVPEVSDTFTFGVRADDFGTFFIDDVQVSWTNYDGSIYLEAGRPYSVRLDAYETNGGASTRLYWSSNKIGGWQIVPARLVWSDVRQINTPSSTPSRTASITKTPTATGTPVILSSGDGWLGRYYSGTSYTTQVGSSVWSTIDLDWGSGGPGGMSDYWSIRFTGFLVPEVSDTFTFGVRADDFGTFFIDDVQVSWTNYDGSIYLEAGRPYSVRLDAYETNGGASTRLYWSGNKIGGWQIVPARLVWSDVRRMASPSVTPPSSRSPSWSASSSPSPASQLSGNGWSATYYTGTNFMTAYAYDTTSTIDIDWGWSGPAGLSDNWCARWTAILVPDYSDTYTFYHRSDDYSILYVNDAAIAWTGNDSSVFLEGGRPYSVRI